jgi:hypothetical protein
MRDREAAERTRRRILREDRQVWRTPWLWWLSRQEARRLGGDLQALQAYTMFLGYPRSGHTLIGSLLNAHPEVVVAHELNALRYVQRGFTREQLFALLVRRDREFGSLGRRWSGYDYAVDGGWQGRWRTLRVIGDKRGGASTRLLHRRSYLLERLRKRVGIPIRVFHHVRNPFDNIAAMARVSGAGLDSAAERYFRNVRWAMSTLQRLDDAELMHVYHERFVDDPAATLRAMLDHLGVASDESYLAACAGRVLPTPRRSRDRFHWPQSLIDSVEARIDQYPHLRGYAFSC